MKSMFLFSQQYICQGSFPPMGLLKTHMEPICSDTIGEKKYEGKISSGSLDFGNGWGGIGFQGNQDLYVLRVACNCCRVPMKVVPLN